MTLTLTESTPVFAPACATHTELFQHPLVEDAPPRLAAAQRCQQRRLINEATSVCRVCPMFADCLEAAICDHDVAGVVAGTTPRQRRAIRAQLGVHVATESLDALAGTTNGGPVDHDEVLRLRRIHPDETLEQTAMRLGCSLSTVKRHLRQERRATTSVTTAPAPRVGRDRLIAAWRRVTGAVTRHAA